MDLCRLSGPIVLGDKAGCLLTCASPLCDPLRLAWPRPVTSICLYAWELWTLTAELQRRIRAMDIRCYCKILRISYKNHIPNEEVRAKIQRTIGPHEDLTIVKRRKLKWYGHVSHSSGLAKTILQSTMKRGWKTKQTEKRGEKTASGNGQAWRSPSLRGQWETEGSGENLL